MVMVMCALCGGHVGSIVGRLGCGGSRIMFTLAFHVHPKKPKYPWTPTLSLCYLTFRPSSCNIATRAFHQTNPFNSIQFKKIYSKTIGASASPAFRHPLKSQYKTTFLPINWITKLHALPQECNYFIIFSFFFFTTKKKNNDITCLIVFNNVNQVLNVVYHLLK